MTEEQKEAFRPAAVQAWSAWADNDAVDILSEAESRKIRQRFKEDHEADFKVLTPRYVFTDKHESLRTPNNPLELKARARIVVRDTVAFSIPKDAPTASRISQHMLFILTASFHKAKKTWRLLSADVKSLPSWHACLKFTWRTCVGIMVNLFYHFHAIAWPG